MLLAFSFYQWFFPQYNGIFSESSTDITTGDGRITASILLVGGLLLWQLTEKKSENKN